jgi:hypothetical protein
VIHVVRNPLYAGAYVFGRTGVRTSILDGRASKTTGHRKPRAHWSVLIRDHHPAYITWQEYERNQAMLAENAHGSRSEGRKSARGGRALLAGLVRCGRCGRMMRVMYGATSHTPTYACRGEETKSSGRQCIAVGGVRVERAVAAQLLDVVAPHAVDAAIEATSRAACADDDVRGALGRQLEEAKYEASLAARRHAAVDPDKRHVARELEARWEQALQQVAEIEERLIRLAAPASPPHVDRATLLTLARDMVAVWNAPTAEPRTKQRLVRILVREVVLDRDDAAREVRVTIHWTGGRHTELRVSRNAERQDQDDIPPSAVDVMRKIGTQFSDRDMAITMNRMRCTGAASWTAGSVRALRERLEMPIFAPDPTAEMLSLNEAARRLGVATDSVRRLMREGVLPGSQGMPSAPWRVPAAALESDAVKAGVRDLIHRRPTNFASLQDKKTLKLPGL